MNNGKFDPRPVWSSQLGRRILLSFLVSSLSGMVILGVYGGSTLRTRAREKAETQFLEELRQIANNIKANSDSNGNDVRFLAATPPVQGMLRAVDNGGYDPIETSSYDKWYGRMVTLMKNLTTTKPYLRHLRFIDENGNELVRVDSDGQRAWEIPQEELQNKAHRYYFQETMKLPPGSLYISPFDLNREKGEIATPPTPMIRHSIPIFDSKGNRRGIIAGNIIGDYLTDLYSTHEQHVTASFICDQDGYYVEHELHPEKKWGGPSDLNTGEGIRKDFPGEAGLILSGKEGYCETSDGGFLFYSPVRLWHENDKFLVLAEVIEPGAVYADFRRLIAVFSIACGISLIVVCIVSYLLARQILLPIRALEKGVNTVSKGELSKPLPISGAGELSDLTAGFNEMAESIRASYEELRGELMVTAEEIEEHKKHVAKQDARLRKLYEVSLLQASTANEFATALLTEAAEMLDTDAAVLAEIHQNTWRVLAAADRNHVGISAGTEQPLEKTYCAHVIARMQPVMIENAAEMEEFRNHPAYVEMGVVSFLGVPVNVRGKTFGVLSTTGKSPHKYSEQDVVLHQLLAQRFAYEIEREQYESELKSGLDNSRRLHEISVEVMSNIDASVIDACDKMLDNLRSMVNARYAAFGLFDGQGKMINFFYSGVGPDTAEKIGNLPHGKGLLGALVYEGIPIRLEDLTKDPRFCGFPPHHPPMKSFLGVPVFAAGKIIGRLYITEKIGAESFSDEDEVLAFNLGNFLGNFITHKHMLEELAVARDEALQASKAKSDFLANMSHELRTPLNAIIGFSEVLADKTFGELNEKQTDYLNDILDSGRHLLTLINDVLDLSKVEAGKMELDISEFSLRSLLESSLTMVKQKAFNHAIDLSIEVAEDIGTIEADERKTKQVVFNLLSNAVKFTPDGGKVTIEATREDDQITVAVSDTGVGISQEGQGKLFQEFEQLDASLARKHEGTGLGLALAKRFIEMHGGRIWAESKGEGHGSRFAFSIPTKHQAIDRNNKEQNE